MNNQDNKRVTSAVLCVVGSEGDLLLTLKYEGRAGVAIIPPGEDDGGAGVTWCQSFTVS